MHIADADSFSNWKKSVAELERRRWLICIPLALAFLVVYFQRVATGVVSDSLMRDFAISRASELGVLSSIYFYTYAIVQLPAGVLADFCGSRRTIAFAVAIAAAGSVLFGWASSLFWLYAGRFLVGFGLAFVYINIVKIFSEWFRTREFGTMTGLSAFIGNAGSMLAATPLALLIEAVGWRTSFIGIGACTLGIAGVCWFFVWDRPSQLKLPSISAIEANEGVPQPPDHAPICVSSGIRVVMGNLRTWPPFLVSGASYGVYMTFIGIWGVPYLMQVYGMAKVEAANFTMLTSAGYMIAGPLLGVVSDRCRTRRFPYLVFMGLMSVAWLLMTFWHGGKPPVWALYPLCFMLGAGSSCAALALACAKEVNPPYLTGISTGFVNIGPFVGTAILQPAFGWMLDTRWQGEVWEGVKVYPPSAYQAAFEMCAAVLVVGLVLTLFIKETHCSNISHQVLGTYSSREERGM